MSGAKLNLQRWTQGGGLVVERGGGSAFGIRMVNPDEVSGSDPQQGVYVAPIETRSISTAEVYSWVGSFAVADYCRRVAEAHNRVVRFLPNSFLPVLWGGDGEPVFLYHFVEGLDAAVDYKELQSQFPSLTLGQIGGAIAFLRGLSQFNVRGVDIDALEDLGLESAPEFQEQIRQSLKEGPSSVLNRD